MTIKTTSLFILLLGTFCSTTAWGTDLHVPDDYSTIQSAVYAASTGDTVHVAAGTYFETVLIHRKTVNLMGDGKETTVLDALGANSVVHVFQANDLTISGFTVQHAKTKWPYAGILLNKTGRVTVTDNQVPGR